MDFSSSLVSHKITPPTNEDGVENPGPVGGRLYVSVLVHSLYGRSHVEGIHLILQKKKKKKRSALRDKSDSRYLLI